MAEHTSLTPSQLKALDRVRRLAWLLDRSIKVPGTRFRFGLDGLIGLIPGIGDGASALLGGTIIAQSLQFELPLLVRVKMLGNLVLDAVVGLVPVLGDLLDIGFQANQRNVQLMLDALEAGSSQQPSRKEKAFGWGVVLLSCVALLGLLVLPIWLLMKIF